MMICIGPAGGWLSGLPAAARRSYFQEAAMLVGIGVRERVIEDGDGQVIRGIWPPSLASASWPI